jgi:hypothetical protein
MDISGLITQDKAESGDWFRVNIYNKDQDFELNIRGNDSDVVQKFNREQVKKMRHSVGKTELDDEALDAMLEQGDEGVLVRIAGIRGLQFDEKHKKITGHEPVTLDGTELKDDRKSYQLLIEKIPAVKDFVLKISGDRANFLGNRKKD